MNENVELQPRNYRLESRRSALVRLHSGALDVELSLNELGHVVLDLVQQLHLEIQTDASMLKLIYMYMYMCAFLVVCAECFRFGCAIYWCLPGTKCDVMD